MKKYKLPFYRSVLASTGWLLLISLLFSCNPDDTPLPVEPVEESARVNKIVWSDKDFQQYTYRSDGKITKYFSQWVYIMDGSGATRQQTINFEYTSSGLLDKVVFDSGFFNKYYYKGSTPKRMEEYDNKGKLRLTHNYIFNAGGKLIESLSQVHDPFEGEANQIKQTYTYDNLGNLTEHRMYNKLQGETTFSLSTITRYEGYDNKKSVDNLSYAFPYLPQIKLFTNNPGKRTTLGQDGSTIISVFAYTYTYNDKGYPTQKSVSVQTSPQAPQVTASYEYE